ncbi:hypothetical protein C7C56_017240 [Massilia glaciei]|uniref:DUF1453 domain-containing protein n=2 Tax=Massilia glaciei TaxID=1524097 RepID=A0A2U2HHY1_9BURK|nr:hypothetical protein C7C56_017240 [Massilia glaciei]
MLLQIISHTPVYVWAILAFLIHRGAISSRDREIEVARLVIIPAAMLGLSLQGIYTTFGPSGVAVQAWAAGAALATFIAFKSDACARDIAHPARGTIAVRGSWLPLTLMLAIFLTKYAVAVAVSVTSTLQRDPLFAIGICALYGAFNGLFAGTLLRSLVLYRRAGAARPAAAQPV